MPPPGFSWVDPPAVAGMRYPDGPADLAWLRANGVQVLVSLTEDPPPRRWVNDAGLFSVHVPVPDMEAPTVEQLDQIADTLAKAAANNMGVAVHCAAGKGRTGTALAAYFVTKGMTARAAVAKVRGLRPGSVETDEQERAVEAFAARRGG